MDRATRNQTIRDFLDVLLTEVGTSANTISAYEYDLRQLEEYLRGRLRLPGEIPWRSIDRATVRGFPPYLEARGYSESSVARKLAAVRGFFAFLEGRGAVSGNPAEGLASPRVPRRLRTALGPDEIARLLDQAAKRRTPEAKRDRAILGLLCSAGMRVSEVVSLDVGDVHIGTASFVRCAGRVVDRRLPVGADVIAAVRSYLEEGRPLLLPDRRERALFLNRRGERLSRQGLWLTIKKYVVAAGLSRRIAPRTLRHSFAAGRLREGASLRSLQEMLGHASIATTKAYFGVATLRG